MVHLRLNERESNPNPHINFVTPLPGVQAAATEDARQLLRALAAQVRPVMKAHGFEVNSFEEYEHNQVFAGRNWNNGETIEIVLRGAHGFFLPTSWLMSTLCHELAHIKHMNHGPAFQALWAQLRREVRNLQEKGYYGDGYWSSGTRLADNARVGSQDLQEGDLPEYMCGGAHTRARPTRRRPRAVNGGPHPTTRKRKPGARVTSKYAFLSAGEGETIGAGKDGFGRRAQSKRAREERAAAAERRFLALQRSQAGSSAQAAGPGSDDGGESDDSDDSVEAVPETDQDRRTVLLGSMSAGDAAALKSGQQRFLDEFLMPHGAGDGGAGGSAPEAGPSCDTVQIGRQGATAAPSSFSFSSSSSSRPKRAGPDSDGAVPPSKRQKASGAGEKGKGKADEVQGALPLAYGALVSDEVSFRRREALGLAGGKPGGRALGGPSAGSVRRAEEPPVGARASRLLGLVPPGEAEKARAREARAAAADPSPSASARGEGGGGADAEWSCLVCTLANAPGHLACSACATPRGDATWGGAHV